MINAFLHRYLLAAIFSLLSLTLTAQAVQEPVTTNADWAKPYPPFRIAGNLYYVGTHDLACYLIATRQGHILINTGLAASQSQIRNNIEKMGFRLADIKLLLTTQAHYDHLGAMAAIKRKTGARVWVNAPDAAVMADGGRSDYALGGSVATFEPVTADSLLHDGDTIRLGETALVMLSHPGHTKGSCSYLLKTKDKQQSYTVLIANMPTIVTEKKFADIAEYPGISKDYASTLAAMKNLSFDLWVASHASQFGLHRKRKPGDRYRPEAFRDKAGYVQAIEALQKQYNDHLGKQ